MGPRRLVAPKMELKDPIQGPKGRPEGAQRGHGDTGVPITLKAFQSDRTQGVPMSARMGLKAPIQGPKGRSEGAHRGHGDTGAPVTLKAFQSDRSQGYQ